MGMGADGGRAMIGDSADGITIWIGSVQLAVQEIIGAARRRPAIRAPAPPSLRSGGPPSREHSGAHTKASFALKIHTGSP